MRNCVFGRYAQAHMNMIHHQVAFNHLRSFLTGQVAEDLTKMLSQHTKYFLLPSLGDEYCVILTIPSCVAQTLIFFHCESPSLGRDFRFTMTDV